MRQPASILLVLAAAALLPCSAPRSAAQAVGAHSAAATPAQFDAWRAQIRKALYIPDPLPPLATKNCGAFSPAPGVIAERVAYATLFGMRVPAIVYSPQHSSTRRLPALIIVNGHGGDKYSWYSFYSGILYARAGGVVLTYDPIGEGERNDQHMSGTREHDRQIDGPHSGQRMGGQMITDVMQAVTYLRQRPDVDPARIAVAGYSMGSFVSALTGALDIRIHAVVLSGGGDLDGNGGYWDSSSKLMCQARPYQALSVLGDKGAVLYALNQRRGPTFIINGTADTLVDIPHHLEPWFQQLRERVEAITGTKRNIFDTYFIPNVSHRPNWVTLPAALWLQQTLNFPNWNAKEIAALPETHISEWAAKNRVDMDRGYIQEDREGGVMALRDDVPNVPRSELNVLTAAKWEQQKANFVYQYWVEHALAADGLTGAAAEAAIVKKPPQTKKPQ